MKRASVVPSCPRARGAIAVRTTSVAVALAAVLATASVRVASALDSAAPAAPDIIQARQSGFKKMGAAMKLITEQLKSDAPDLPKITAAAQAISTGARDQPSWFPAGSGPESGVETDALPHIWQDAAKFAALSNQLGIESATFSAAVASNDVVAIRTRFKSLADVCSTSHKSFRAD